jgi:hypothetical protein
MAWWQEYISSSNNTVNSPTIVATAMMVLTGILFLLAIILVCYHCFYHGKGIDSETVKLILGLIVGGGGTGGLGAYLTRSASDSISSRMGGKARPKPEPERD